MDFQRIIVVGLVLFLFTCSVDAFDNSCPCIDFVEYSSPHAWVWTPGDGGYLVEGVEAEYGFNLTVWGNVSLLDGSLYAESVVHCDNKRVNDSYDISPVIVYTYVLPNESIVSYLYHATDVVPVGDSCIISVNLLFWNYSRNEVYNREKLCDNINYNNIQKYGIEVFSRSEVEWRKQSDYLKGQVEELKIANTQNKEHNTRALSMLNQSLSDQREDSERSNWTVICVGMLGAIATVAAALLGAYYAGKNMLKQQSKQFEREKSERDKEDIYRPLLDALESHPKNVVDLMPQSDIFRDYWRDLKPSDKNRLPPKLRKELEKLSTTPVDEDPISKEKTKKQRRKSIKKVQDLLDSQ